MLLGSKYNPRPTQIVRRQFNSDLVPWQDADVVHAHLAGNMTQYDVSIFQLDSERGVRKVFYNLALHLNNIVF